MKNIKLINNKGIALVNDEDFDYLNQWSWHLSKKMYAANKSRIYMHRLIMETPKGYVTDHINRNTLDNRRVNLRIITNSQNLMNREKSKKNTSGYKGVTWNKERNKWKAQIGFNNKNIFIGRFSTREEAAQAYNLKSKELFPEIC